MHTEMYSSHIRQRRNFIAFLECLSIVNAWGCRDRNALATMILIIKSLTFEIAFPTS